MPRWPAGLHVQAGVQRPRRGMVQQRVRPPGQAEYWRRVQVPLFASAAYRAGGVVGGSIPPLSGAQPEVPYTASIGPHGVGEVWTVDLVQVQAGTQHGQPPLVVQQIQAQQAGTTTTPPPPIVAQVWLAAGGTNIHLLGQTTTGGNDGLDVGGVTVTPGEQIAVVWYNVASVVTASLWFTARGTKTVLMAEG